MVTKRRINWSPTPPKERIQVFSLAAKQTISVIAAGPVRGVLTHWDAEKKCSVPCQCENDAHEEWGGQTPTWRGYLPAYWHNGRKVIVQVTLGAVQHCAELLHADITGKWLKFKRPRDASNGAVYCEIQEAMRRALNVVPYDPTTRLLEMWGLDADQVPDQEGGSNGQAPQDT